MPPCDLRWHRRACRNPLLRPTRGSAAMPPSYTASDVEDHDPCFFRRIHSSRRVPGVQIGDLARMPELGPGVREASADAADPLPPAAASQARCAEAPRVRPDPRAGAPILPLLLPAEAGFCRVVIGLEGVGPRHHRSGAASTRRLTTGLPLRLCAVPRTPRPVARPIVPRGYAVRRASSPQPSTPRCDWLACTEVHCTVWTKRLAGCPT